MTTVLAIDLGGSALKACLFDVDGEPLASTSIPLGFDEDPIGHSEQDPQRWWDALAVSVSQVRDHRAFDAGDIAAIVICGFTRTQIFLNDHGHVLRPAIGFRDSRSLGPANEALAKPGVVHHLQARHLNAFHPLARLLWLQHNEPETWGATHLVLEPKDYLNLRLTGHAMSDRISQSWLISAMRGSEPTLARLAGVERDLLPEIGDPTTLVGRVRDGLPGALSALAGAQVLCGSNDTWTAVAGLGAMRQGCAYCISGSSEVFGLLTGTNTPAEGLITIGWANDLWQIGGPGQNGSNAINWIVEVLDPGERPLAQKLDTLLAQPVNRRPLIFHPYLHGERTPFWDRDLRASFIGLTAAHGPGDMVRAVMEGVALLNRTVLQRAEAAAGHKADEVRIAGGGARNAVWNGIRANILGRRVLASPANEMGLRGCLAIARVGLALNTDVGAAGIALSDDFTFFEPDHSQSARYRALYSVFEETMDSVAQASHRLAAIGREQFDGN
ncbi:FGGY family carbohydrate kinase [Mesorhizobium sp.]|uniref:xylulokinase n=1 Tax=Mesorhizobium sp. TaxID=1871066 RepID=UPI000FE476D3|nr:FGGY family carbohydrate kinase [Mesorhizobium sp.]RWI72197.1 MAG: carbohydrate kinase [Mesorhizobium sp.]